MSKNFKKILILFLTLFLFYFAIGLVFSYFLNTLDYYNIFFGSDSNRVFIDLTVRVANHYRTSVHPLFVILFQPLVKILNFGLNNSILSSLALQSFFNAGSLTIIYLFLEKINLNNKVKKSLFLIMAISFGQIVYSATLETYPFAQFFLILLFYFAYCKKDKTLLLRDYIIFTLLGVGCLSVTLTNYFVYLLVMFYIIFFNDKSGKKIINKLSILFLCILASFGITVVLSELQAVLFPDSSLFFLDNLKAIFMHSSEELNYVEKFSLLSVVRQIKTVFSYSFISPKVDLIFDETNMVLNFDSMYFINKLIVIFTILLIGILIVNFVKKEKRNLMKHSFFLLLIVSFAFNFCLHLFYGNSESFLYILHYQFLLILITAYLIQFVDKKYQKFSEIVLLTFLMLELILNSISVFKMFDLLKNVYEIRMNIDLVLLIIYIICSYIIICLAGIPKKWKIASCIILTVILAFTFNKIDYTLKTKNEMLNYIDATYEKQYDLYSNQLEKLKNEYNVNVAYNNSDKLYLFGMGNRKKLLYTNGILYDLKNKTILYNFYPIGEMIIPNMYTVSLKDKNGNKYVIYENEDGIYLKTNDEDKVSLDDSEKINLPDFNNFKYSEILKVLHQEILFNIDNNELKPNILVYDNGWYRDAMMGAMVLEKTFNLNLIKPWVDRINNIYDEQNGTKEADNLGELLYLISVTNSSNPIINEIFSEVERIKNENNTNYIIGSTDNQILAYYPTAVLKFALERENYDAFVELPKEYDNYTSLVWFYDKDKNINADIDDIQFPYLGWARYHTNKKSNLYICDSLYPLSYEKNAAFADYKKLDENINFYKENSISPTHVWDAAEKFLLLYEVQ